jgi:hypothetical protein
MMDDRMRIEALEATVERLAGDCGRLLVEVAALRKRILEGNDDTKHKAVLDA